MCYRYFITNFLLSLNIIHRTRQLKRLLGAESNEYPTSIAITIPHTAHTSSDPLHWLDVYNHYVSPILLFPVVEPKEDKGEFSYRRNSEIGRRLRKKLTQQDMIDLQREEDEIPAFIPSATDLPPYVFVNLVCEMCFRSVSDDTWPVKVSWG